MLFRALMNRMCRLTAGSALVFGDALGSETGLRVSSEKYPNFLSLLSHLLQSPVEKENNSANEKQAWEFSSTTERVLPALALIGEQIPSLSGQDDQILRELVYRQFHNPVWGIREQAARIYASFLDHSEILSTVGKLSNRETFIENQNHLHGNVLCIRYALQRIWATYDGYWRGEYLMGSSQLPELISHRYLCRHTSRYRRCH
jgi:hypothetical protein